MKEYGINLVFAVTQEREDIYSRLKKEIDGSSVGILNSDDSIVNLVVDYYNVRHIPTYLT